MTAIIPKELITIVDGLPTRYDFSSGKTTNLYMVETRHQLIPNCPHCHRFRPVVLDGDQYWAYFMKGGYADQVFTHLTPSQRELLISGIHPECWKAFVGPDEDGEE